MVGDQVKCEPALINFRNATKHHGLSAKSALEYPRKSTEFACKAIEINSPEQKRMLQSQVRKGSVKSSG